MSQFLRRKWIDILDLALQHWGAHTNPDKPREPISQSSLFWGILGLLTIGPTLYASWAFKDFRWALYGSIPTGIGLEWVIIRQIPASKAIRRFLLALAALATLVAARKVDVRYSPQPLIPAVTPAEMKYSNLSGEVFTATLSNVTSNEIFMASVILSTIGKGETTDFMVDVPKTELKQLTNGSQFADVAGLRCRAADGTPTIIMFFYRLSAGEVRHILVAENGNTSATLKASLGNYSKDQVPLTNDKSGQISMPFQPPISVMCDSYLYWMLEQK